MYMLNTQSQLCYWCLTPNTLIGASITLQATPTGIVLSCVTVKLCSNVSQLTISLSTDHSFQEKLSFAIPQVDKHWIMTAARTSVYAP